ncbi:hypothetical protein WDW37_09535 [Bdellovibrionota bacterium FG-1]
MTFKGAMMGLVVAGILGQNALADSVLISRSSYYETLKSSSYLVDSATGSASVVLKLQRLEEGDPSRDHASVRRVIGAQRTSVMGLSFDVPSSQIIFASSKGKVVCATVTEKTGFFGGRKLVIKNTGDCRVISKVEQLGLTITFDTK